MKVVDKNEIFKGKILTVFRKIVKNKDGSLWERETVGYCGEASVVLAVNNEKVILVSQFRPSCECFLLELPAGRIEKNETPEQCALREFEEEVGLVPKTVRKLLEFYTSPGFVEEKVHLFYADDFLQSNKNLDKGEEVEMFLLPCDLIDEYLFGGKIIDAKTIIGLLALKVMKNGNK